MIGALEPVWRQFSETYLSIRQALGEMSDDRLLWTPGPKATSAASIVRHIARANLVYCSQIEGNPARAVLPEEEPDRAQLLELLDRSEERVRSVFDQATEEELRALRAEDWGPLGYPVEGPLDGLWFAHQIVRHSAYHMGQIVYLLLLLEGERVQPEPVR